MPWIGTEAVDWASAAIALGDKGWLRLEGVVEDHARAALAEAAPPTWAPLPEVEGRVRQGGASCGVFFESAPAPVQEFGREICDSLTVARPDLPPVP